ncbi:MAG: ABC transporter substrate-binding protein [Caldilineaceae bacterium]|nr:ABC transporter substrate-binding protein [Caldilineaceae bacterium]
MNHRLVTLLSFGIIVVMMMAGCGSSEAPPAEEAAAAEPTAAEEAAAEPAAAEEAAPAAASADGAHEAPMLAEKVAAGELPPLDERIPNDPLVIEPYGEIGQYGGTMHRFDTSTDGSHLAMFQYGYSPVHWVQDGLDKRPGLAKEWSFNDDKTEYTLIFREGTRWSDGEPFTVDDFLYWWEEMVLNPEHTDVPPDYLISGGKVADITKVDDYTLNFKFAAPSPLFLDRLAMWPNGTVPGSERLFVPKHYLEQFNPDFSDEYDTFEVHDEKMDWRANPEAPVLNPWMPVEYEPGTRMKLERNPYYYAVDTAGNQLPYIDYLDVTFVEDSEVARLRVLAGEQEFCGRMCQSTPLSDLSLFRDAESEVGLVNGLWDSGGGSGPSVFVNWTHQDPDKRALYQDKTFRRALSHAIDREKIQKIIYFGTGELTTGTMSPKGIEFQDEAGQEIYQQWRDLAIDFDLEKAGAMLDEAGAVDADGDGFRDMPNGNELLLRIDCSAGGIANTSNAQAMEIIKEGWEAAGLKVQINVTPDEAFEVMKDNSEWDIHGCWGIGDGPNFLVFPNWVVPVDNNRWAPLYGAWYKVIGTDKEGTELDMDPLDRTPPREEPAEGDPVWKLWELYDAARVEADDAERLRLSQEIAQVHIDEGPFFIGTVANAPYIISWLDKMGNIPTREQLGQGGFIGPWIMSYFGAIYPEQFYIKE